MILHLFLRCGWAASVRSYRSYNANCLSSKEYSSEESCGASEEPLNICGVLKVGGVLIMRRNAYLAEALLCTTWELGEAMANGKGSGGGPVLTVGLVEDVGKVMGNGFFAES